MALRSASVPPVSGQEGVWALEELECAFPWGMDEGGQITD